MGIKVSISQFTSQPAIFISFCEIFWVGAQVSSGDPDLKTWPLPNSRPLFISHFLHSNPGENTWHKFIPVEQAWCRMTKPQYETVIRTEETQDGMTETIALQRGGRRESVPLDAKMEKDAREVPKGVQEVQLDVKGKDNTAVLQGRIQMEGTVHPMMPIVLEKHLENRPPPKTIGEECLQGIRRGIMQVVGREEREEISSKSESLSFLCL